MAPTALDKAISERDSTRDLLQVIEDEVKDDASVPIEEPAANHLFNLLRTAQTDLLEIHKRIQLTGPADMAPHVAEFRALLSKSNQILNGLTGIRNRFAPAAQPPPSSHILY